MNVSKRLWQVKADKFTFDYEISRHLNIFDRFFITELNVLSRRF